MKKTIILTSLISLSLVGCDKKPEEIPKIPVIITNSNNVQTQVMTPLPPPVPVPQPQTNSQMTAPPVQEGQNTQQTNKKVDFTPVVSQNNIPSVLPPASQMQAQPQFNRNDISAPTINDLGNNKTEVVYFGAKEIIDGKFLNMERKPEGFLITTTAKKYFINY